MTRNDLIQRVKGFRGNKADKARWDAVTTALAVAKKWPTDIPFPVAKIDGYGIVTFKVKRNDAVIGRIVFNGTDMLFSAGDTETAKREDNLQTIFDAFMLIMNPPPKTAGQKLSDFKSRYLSTV